MTAALPIRSGPAERAAEWLQSIDVGDMQALREWCRSGQTPTERRRRLVLARTALRDALDGVDDVQLIHGASEPRPLGRSGRVPPTP